MSESNITPLGITNYQNEQKRFGIRDIDRMGQMYCMGKTGVGKSTLIKNMICSDIERGNGICLIDPHGDLAIEILDNIPPHRIRDVVYFNPSNTEFPIPFNPLKGVHPNFHHLVASGIISTLKKVWSESWGPRMEHILRFSLLSLLQFPDATLLDIQPLLTDDEYGFATTRKDGKASGIIWRGAGVSANKNAYGYKYDQVGRLAHAEYREYSNSTYISQIDINGNPIYAQGVNWNKQHKDYTAMNMTYDVNGNMLSMTQVGVPLGYNNPVYIDVMKYSYGAGNRQTGTADAIHYNYHLDEFVDGTCDPEPAGPGEFDPPLQNKGDGDPTTMEPYFELGNPPPAPTMGCVDYEFDKNGNLTHDGNKWMDIAYNYMNLPIDITVLNGSGNNSNQTSTIHNTYDGSGRLLRKVIKDYTVDPPKIDKYDYAGPFTYRNDSLLDVGHEEGKARYVATAAQFTYDYFVEDHLGNVRAVINAEAANPITQVATFELASANLESSIFSHINEVNSSNPIPGIGNTRAAKLNGAYDSTRIGASLLLRVMPEDEIELSSLYYYDEDTVTHTVTPSADMLGSLVSALTGGVGGYSGNEGPPSRIISGLLNSTNYTTYFDAIKEAQTDPNLPRAYLSYMVFDRNMNLLADKSGVIQVGAVSGSWELMELDHPLVIGQDGYVLISVGDEIDKEVHFDQVKVIFYKGLIKQEQHYYPYGLAIKAGEDASVEPNQNKYQGKELQDELNVQLYDFHARQYDPQIGKFWGLDPADQFPSGYTGMGNDPANMVDPTGMKAVHTAMDPAEDEYRWNDEYGKSVLISAGGNNSGVYVADPSNSLDEYMQHMENMELEPQGEEAVELRAEVDNKTNSQETKDDGEGNRDNGETKGIAAAAVPIGLIAAAADGPIPVGDVIGVGVIVGAALYDAMTIKFVTYTLINPETNQIYVGRASGYGNPQSIMMNRFYGHEKRKEGFCNPQLDKVGVGFPVGYYAIRGREQNLVDAYGGIGSPALGNKINPISIINPNRPIYLGTSHSLFGTYTKP